MISGAQPYAELAAVLDRMWPDFEAPEYPTKQWVPATGMRAIFVDEVWDLPERRWFDRPRYVETMALRMSPERRARRRATTHWTLTGAML